MTIQRRRQRWFRIAGFVLLVAVAAVNVIGAPATIFAYRELPSGAIELLVRGGGLTWSDYDRVGTDASTVSFHVVARGLPLGLLGYGDECAWVTAWIPGDTVAEPLGGRAVLDGETDLPVARWSSTTQAVNHFGDCVPAAPGSTP
jgi:hypothetical protein